MISNETATKDGCNGGDAMYLLECFEVQVILF